MRTKKFLGASLLTGLILVIGQLCGTAVVIQGYVWVDANANNTLDVNEQLLGGIDVLAYRNLTPIPALTGSSTTTSSSGTYTGSGTPFNYRLEFTTATVFPSTLWNLRFEFPSSGYTGFVTPGSLIMVTSSNTDSDVDGTFIVPPLGGADFYRTANFTYADGSFDEGQIGAGYVPVPEPVNVALSICGALVLAFSVLRRLQVKKFMAVSGPRAI